MAACFTGDAETGEMQLRAILKTTDLVLMSRAKHLLAEAGVPHLEFDTHMSFTEGSIGAFPRRLMVRDEDMARARAALAPLADYLLPEDEG